MRRKWKDIEGAGAVGKRDAKGWGGSCEAEKRRCGCSMMDAVSFDGRSWLKSTQVSSGMVSSREVS